MNQITTRVLQDLCDQQQPIAALTAYDYTLAYLVDQAGVDVVLVGDSAANVVGGHATTLPITLNQMIYHASAVVRAVQRALVVVDLPFGSYTSAAKGLAAGVKVLKKTGAQAVKLEGGEAILETVTQLVTQGVPVMGHLGLQPQSVHTLGGYSLQGKENEAAERITQEALSLQEAGCFALVLEKIPSELAKSITQKLRIPTIGIGAGPAVSGQILVLHDMLGLTQSFAPRFVKKYAALGQNIQEALKQYVHEVKRRQFPSDKHSY